ncbi:MAG: hypothetical protein RLZZ385_2527 [Pseudomonadota bacterium]|jgi:DUF971 family protein
MTTPRVPVEIKLHRRSGVLELVYGGGVSRRLDAEFLRVHSPSAEVKGHGQGQEVLQHGKLGVRITAVESVGNYAIRLVFDDGHSSGIYSWNYLLHLHEHQAELWQAYLDRLAAAGKSRDALPPGVQVITIKPPL